MRWLATRIILMFLQGVMGALLLVGRTIRHQGTFTYKPMAQMDYPMVEMKLSVMSTKSLLVTVRILSLRR